MKNSAQQFDRMMNTPVQKLIPTLAGPTMLSMMTSAIYNTTDTWWVSHLGDSATAAIGVGFPLLAFIQAFGFWIGMGAASNISRYLGKKCVHKASTIASTAIVMAFCAGFMILTLGLLFNRAIVSGLGATPTILPYAQEYSRIILWGAPLTCASFVFNNLLRSQGRAFFAMIGIVSGSIINLALDPLFIFGMDMGIKGAALSTVLCQAIGFTFMGVALFRKDSMIRPGKRYISSIPGVYMLILSTGLPSLFRQGCAVVANVLMNRAGACYGDAAVAAMSIVGKISFMFGSVVVGFGQGFQPVVGFAYGADNYTRVRQCYKFSLMVMLMLCCVFGVICWTLPERIMQLFNVESHQVVEIGAYTLQLISFSIPFQAVVILANMLLQVTGQKLLASITSLMRQGVIYIPYIIIMPAFIGLRAVQTVQPVSDIIAGIVAGCITWIFFRNLGKKTA